jgi:hypothetical protein
MRPLSTALRTAIELDAFNEATVGLRFFAGIREIALGRSMRDWMDGVPPTSSSAIYAAVVERDILIIDHHQMLNWCRCLPHLSRARPDGRRRRRSWDLLRFGSYPHD